MQERENEEYGEEVTGREGTVVGIGRPPFKYPSNPPGNASNGQMGQTTWIKMTSSSEYENRPWLHLHGYL